MTSDNILTLMESVPEKYLMEAQELRKSPANLQSHRRPNVWLIAAAVTATLLLVGCVAAYLGLKNYSIGTTEYTEEFNREGLATEQTQKVKDILVFSGHSGEPAYEAQKEWLQCLGANPLAEEASVPDGITDAEARTYGCASTEMAGNLHAIAEKYDLKLLDVPVILDHFEQDSLYLEALGMENILHNGAPEQLQQITGFSLPPRNFLLNFFLNGDSYTYPVTYVYQDKGYMPSEFSIQADLSKFNQWEYATASGEKLTLALDGAGQGIIVGDFSNCVISILVDGNRTNSKFPSAEGIISAKELEALAEEFNFSVSPGTMTSEELSAAVEEMQKAWTTENPYVPEIYSQYGDFLKNYLHYGFETFSYAFHDMNADGTDDFLLLQEDGKIELWLEQKNGQVAEHYNLSNSYLCENQIVETIRSMPIIRQEQHTFHRLTKVLAEEERYGEILTVLNTSDGQWNVGTDPNTSAGEMISAEKAQEIMAQYPRLSLDRKPIMEFPMDESGQTLGDYADSINKPLAAEELNQGYKALLHQEEYMEFSHYAILDINGDGVEDLLLSRNGIVCHLALTYAYGKMNTLQSGEFQICRNHIVDKVLHTADANGAEKEQHSFIKLNGEKKEALDALVYDKSTASWQADFSGTPLEKNEAETIIAQYPHAELEWMPIP